MFSSHSGASWLPPPPDTHIHPSSLGAFAPLLPWHGHSKGLHSLGSSSRKPSCLPQDSLCRQRLQLPFWPRFPCQGAGTESGSGPACGGRNSGRRKEPHINKGHILKLRIQSLISSLPGWATDSIFCLCITLWQRHLSSPAWLGKRWGHECRSGPV